MPKATLSSFDCHVCLGDRDIVSGTVTVAAPATRIHYNEVATPQIILRRNDAFARLFRLCADIPPVRCAIVHPCDRDSLLGPLEAAKRGLIEPIFVGPEHKIRAVAEAENVDLSPYRLVSTEHSQEAAQVAVAMARKGEVESLMKGSLHTDELMSAVVPSATGLRTSRRISHVFVMDVPAYPRLLVVTDAAINIAPSAKDKADIVQNAIELAHVLGIERRASRSLPRSKRLIPKCRPRSTRRCCVKWPTAARLRAVFSTDHWHSITRSVKKPRG